MWNWLILIVTCGNFNLTGFPMTEHINFRYSWFNPKHNIYKRWTQYAYKSGMFKSYIWGSFLHPDLRYFQLKYDSEIWNTGWGGQNRPSEFFWGRDLFWWLQNGAPKKYFTPGLWATGKTYKSEISQRASHHQYRTSEFYSAKLANWLSY